MRFNKITSAEDFQLINSFDEVKRRLLEETKFSDRLDKPLAYWALPNDRRLPLAFLGRTIGDLLATPFEELSATPGIGQKKISSLVTLLNRATKEDAGFEPAQTAPKETAEEDSFSTSSPLDADGKFDPALVSEVLWLRWRETVRRHNLGNERLGRLAPSLADLPTVIWNTPLEFYMGHSLAEIRRLKTHGEKRVRVVLEVFYRVHETLDLAQGQPHLAIVLRPKMVPVLESWGLDRLAGEASISRSDVMEHLTRPLLKQILTDAGETVHELATGRLGIEAAPQSVRLQARNLGVTRARIYQLLEDCQKIMAVRWPEGRALLEALCKKTEEKPGEAEAFQLLSATRDLFYASKTEEDEVGAEEPEAVAG
ncbi:hypothetical protein GC197_17160 [bacterium]|nr:hypothetical protein [bacterium]